MNTNKLNRLIAGLMLVGAVAIPTKLLAAATTVFKTPEMAMEAFGAAVNSDDGAGVQSYDDAEAQEVTDRLAGLGYL